MPAPTVSELREELAENLSTIADAQVSAWMLSNPTPGPGGSIEVVPDEVAYDTANARGLDTYRFIVRAYLPLGSDIGAQKRLDALLAPAGATSVKAALEADTTLDGKAQDLRVVDATGYRVFGRAGAPELLGCEWTVEVIAAGE